jgi:predicted kinase
MPTLTLTLIRGLPGSGKSTLAKKRVEEAANSTGQTIAHLEADMYFIDDAGVYFFQPEFIKKAHAWCQQACENLLQQQQSVIVSNTFIKHWEMKAYQQLAKQYNAKLEVIVCKGKYANIHEVPVETVKRMQQQWQA